MSVLSQKVKIATFDAISSERDKLSLVLYDLVNGKFSAATLATDRCPHCQDRPGKDGLGRMCKTCGGSGDVPALEGIRRVAEQFDRQARESRELANLLEDCESITLEVSA